MKIWLVTKLANNDPRQCVYILGAHSSQKDALLHQKQVEDPDSHTTHLVEMDVDKKQPPVLIGVADSHPLNDCKKILPHG